MKGIGSDRSKGLNRSTRRRSKISISTQLKLWVCAGGRCEFLGCNEPLLRDGLTLQETNYSNIAHIVAWSTDGARGDDPLPLADRNRFGNLMLVCTKHHKLIDSEEHAQEYPKELLHEHKSLHEDRIASVTAYQPESKTSIVRMKSNIAGEVVEVPMAHIREAISPRYPVDLAGIEIDLTYIRAAENAAYYSTMADAITQRIAGLYAPGMETDPAQHVSVFALGPIPLLVHLGRCLSNKVPCDIYQRHRDSEDWKWKGEGDEVSYRVSVLNRRSSDKVALVLSLSGKILERDLPKRVVSEFTVYEITLKGMTPSPSFLRTRANFEGFNAAYRDLLRTIRETHGAVKAIHLFAAVPAPVAVACGRETLRKVDPPLLVYDYDRKKGGFKLKLKVD
jgi:hypothetical protein